MSLLTEALKDIDHWIETSNSWHAKRIRSDDISPEFRARPGLEREMIDLFAEEYNFTFSEEVYELYQWHNGGFEIGDMANPVFFTSLEHAVEFIIRGDTPHRPYLPLFIGDRAYFTIPESTHNEQQSPLFFYDGSISTEAPKPDPRWGSFRADYYAPSITALMQAMAECAKTHDGISAEYLCMDRDPREIYNHGPRERHSILTPIYRKYGITGASSGLWR